MDITMPQLGETVTEGTITKWMKNVGDNVALDEVLFEVSTDKVDSEVPSPSAGVLSEIVVNEGDLAQVGDVLARISDAGSAPVAETPAPAEAPAQAPAPTEQAAPAPAPVSEQAPSSFAPPVQAPAPEPAQASAPAPVTLSETDGSNTQGILLSPIVRKMANDNSINVNSIAGTGVGGRITKEDVEKAIAQKSSTPAPAPAPEPAQAPAQAQTPAPQAQTPAAPAQAPATQAPQGPAGQDIVIPFDNLRRRTAEHMIRSKAISAHVYTSVEVDFENVANARKAEGKAFKEKEGFSLTYLPFIVRALSEALPDFPNVNASVDGDNLVVHPDFHVGIAVDLDFKGLLVPAVRNAQGKKLRLIAQEIRDLAVRAKSKQLRPDEVIGSTFTISNPGPLGTFMTMPIINQPQVAILATDGIAKKPVVVQDSTGADLIAIHHVGILTLGWDHRAFDGGYAAAFLARVREILQTRDWVAEV